jgi:hypothetical protein
MPREPGPIAPESLYPRRLAVRALGLVLQHYGLADVAVKFNPDDPQQAFPGPGEGEIRLFLDGWDHGQRPVAAVYVIGARARVVVFHVRDLVRRSHKADFRPEEIGIVPERGEHDIDMEVDLSSEIDLLGETLRHAPQRVVASARRGRGKPVVIMRGRSR